MKEKEYTFTVDAVIRYVGVVTATSLEEAEQKCLNGEYDDFNFVKFYYLLNSKSFSSQVISSYIVAPSTKIFSSILSFFFLYSLIISFAY